MPQRRRTRKQIFKPHREVDSVIHVVRCFENNDITHVDGSIDPARDIETINLELILSDLDILARRIDSRKKAMKGDKTIAPEVAFLEKLYSEMEEGKTARSVEISRRTSRNTLKRFRFLQ